MPDLVDPDDLIATLDAAEILGLSGEQRAVYSHRYGDFLRPVVETEP